MEIFKPETIQARKQKVQNKWDLHLKNEDLILVFCGSPIQKPGGLDQTYSFLPHPEYFWLTGSRRALGILAYSKPDGWTHFTQHVTRDEKIWEGSAENETINSGVPIEKFGSWLLQKNASRILCLGLPSEKQRSFEKSVDFDFRSAIQESLNQVRRCKDNEEVELIQNIAAMAAQGYTLLKKVIRPGVSERQIQIEYEAEVLRAGSEKFPYDTIVGSGTNAAILHAIPTSKIVQKNEMVLIDAGADLHDYCVDITRIFPSEGKFTSQQQSIYDLVLKAQAASIEKCRPGVEWTEVHLTSARVIAEGLKDLNLLQGNTDTLLESGAVATFFPHGVGHMVGLKVRDVGPRFNATPKICCGVRLRVDLKLEENFLMTVEPGVYFVKALLEDSEIHQKFRNEINWSEVEKWKHVGGVRLEDDILVTGQGPRNLTSRIEK